MPNYQVPKKLYCGSPSVTLRLTKEHTRGGLSQFQDAVKRGVGLSLVFEGWRGAISLIWTPEHGHQIVVGAFGDKGRVISAMRGYSGPWSHVELTYPTSLLDHIGTLADYKSELVIPQDLAQQNTPESSTNGQTPPPEPARLIDPVQLRPMGAGTRTRWTSPSLGECI